MKKISFLLLFLWSSVTYGQKNLAVETYNQGLLLYYNKDFSSALEKFSKAIESDPSLGDAYYNRALCRMQTGNFDEAIADYTLSLEKSSVNLAAIIYGGRAKAKYLNDQKSDALIDYLEAIKKDDKNPDWYYFAGGILFEMGKYQQAIEQFNAAINLRNNFAEAYNDRGSAKKILEDYQGAISDFHQARRFKPELVVAYNNLATTLIKAGDSESAMKEFNQSLVVSEKQSETYVKRGKFKFDSGDFEGAMRDFNRAIEISPLNFNALNNRACLKNKMKDYQGALEDLNKAINIDPSFGYAYLNRGIVKENLLDLTGACADWNLALQNGMSSVKIFIQSECN